MSYKVSAIRTDNRRPDPLKKKKSTIRHNYADLKVLRVTSASLYMQFNNVVDCWEISIVLFGSEIPFTYLIHTIMTEDKLN